MQYSPRFNGMVMKKFVPLMLLFIALDCFGQGYWTVFKYEDIIPSYAPTQFWASNTIGMAVRQDTLMLAYTSYVDNSNKCLYCHDTSCSIRDWFFNNLVFDDESSAWFSKNNGGSSRIIRKGKLDSNDFKYVYLSDTDSLQLRNVLSITKDLNNSIWALALCGDDYSDSLTLSSDFIMKFDGVKFRKIHSHTFPTGSFLKLKNNKIICDKSNRIWELHTDSINIYSNSELDTTLCIRTICDSSLGYFQDIVCSPDGTVYLINNQLELYAFKDSRWSLDKTMFSLEFPENPNLDQYKPFICSDSTGNIFARAGFYSKYLYRYSTSAGWSRITLPDEYLTYESLVTVLNIQSDSHGKIWAAGNKLGVFRLDSLSFTSTNGTEHGQTGVSDIWINSLTPNPAHDNARIEFYLEDGLTSELKAGLYSIMGERVVDIVGKLDFNSSSNLASIEFSVSDIPQGVYFVHLEAGNAQKTKMLLVLR